MPLYYRHFGLERDPFLDTADPHFYWESADVCAMKRRLLASIEQSRGLTVVIGDPGTGKTSLSSALEQELLANDEIVLAKILDPVFTGDVEFLTAVGRAFGMTLPPRSSAALRNALKNFFFDSAVLENRTLALIIDEAQNLSDDNLETLRLLLNYDIPQRKLLNIILFGQSELEPRIVARQNLADRVDTWMRIAPLDYSTARALVEYRLERAGMAPGARIFDDEGLDVLLTASGGLPRRLMTIAHGALEEAAYRGAPRVGADEAILAARSRGITVDLPPKNGAIPAAVTVPTDVTEPERAGKPGLLTRLFTRR